MGDLFYLDQWESWKRRKAMLALEDLWGDFCEFFVEGDLLCARRRDNGHRFAAGDWAGLRTLLEDDFAASPFRGEIVRFDRGGWISGPCLPPGD